MTRTEFFRKCANTFRYTKEVPTEGIRTEVDEAPGFRIWRGRPYTSMPPHWHDQVEINYSVGGSLTYLLAGSVVRVPPGRLSLFWAGIPHSVVSGGGIENFYWVYLPLVWLLRLGLPESFMRRVMGGELLVDAEPSGADPVMLEKWCEELPEADDARRRLIIREVEARVMRLALAQADGAGDAQAPAEAGPARKVAEMARFVAENHARPLRVKDVARHVGLHPNYAMTLFRRLYGMTLSAYLTRLRVCQAQHLLISTDRDTSQIAFEVGFGSTSRFYEAFKEMSGYTPHQYRVHSQPKSYRPKSPFNPCSRQ
ncbi:Melibiose operon regulatory protein [Rubrobacter xylanophilus DSM 9941]|nr:Melibiose operon regulatory protein [Rubrobacter xylanophilus DSM 9941]